MENILKRQGYSGWKANTPTLSDRFFSLIKSSFEKMEKQKLAEQLDNHDHGGPEEGCQCTKFIQAD